MSDNNPQNSNGVSAAYSIEPIPPSSSADSFPDSFDAEREVFSPYDYNRTPLTEGTRFQSANRLVGWSMALAVCLVGVGVIVDCSGFDSPIVEAGFDLFKMVIMSILGYMFGTRGDISGT